MGKLKHKIKNMSLQKSLYLIIFIVLIIVSSLTIFTTLITSKARQDIMSQREIVVTGYNINNQGNSIVYNVDKDNYEYQKLAPAESMKYNIYSSLMIVLPIIYIMVGGYLIVYIYYKIKLKTPMSLLSDGIKNLLEDNLDFSVQYAKNDELGLLCQTLEKVRSELYDNNKRMWNLLEERKVLTDSVSHDLRTPITVMKGYLEYLEKSINKNKLDPKNIETTLRSMNEAIYRLENYVNSIQNIQKIDNIKLEKNDVYVKDFISGLKKDFLMIAKEKNRKLVIEDKIDLNKMCIDKSVVYRILENIIDNAFRYSKEMVVIYINQRDKFLEFQIIDDGDGFSEDDLKNATNRFYTSKSNSGLFGIGLTISKILCEKHGGAIKVRNDKKLGASITFGVKII